MTTTITKRSAKGSPLTSSEVDANFQSIVDNKAELDGSTPFTGAVSFGASSGTAKTTVSSSGIVFPDNSVQTSAAQVGQVTPKRYTVANGGFAAGATSITDAAFITLASIDWYRDGVRLDSGVHYTMNTSTNVIAFVTPLGALTEISAYKSTAQTAVSNMLPLTGGTVTGNTTFSGNNTYSGTSSFTGAVNYTGGATYAVRPTFNGATPWDTGNYLDTTGCCYLTRTSDTVLTLSRFNGKTIPINGVLCTIPSAGITLAPTGTAANTLYYVYVYMNAGVMTLEYATTGHSIDANTGVEIKTGDATRTLVGMFFTNVAGSFAVTTNTNNVDINVLSYFNRRALDTGVGNAGSAQSDTPWHQINFLTWLNEEFSIGVNGYGATSASGNTSTVYITIDGNQATTGQIMAESTAGYGWNVGIPYPARSAVEGKRVYQLRGKNDGQLLNMTAQSNLMTRG